MELKQLKVTWDNLGKWDPLWAILTQEDKINRGWKPEEFFKTGEDEIAEVLRQVDRLIPGLSRRKALDFGCGVGRLTQALGRHFEECHGVDIAPSMIKLARKHNRWGKRCQYYVNDRDDLRIFRDNTFDFIYSNFVLQHMKPDYSKAYLREFLRVLAPGGLIVFQLTSERPAPLGKTSTRIEPLPAHGFLARITGPAFLLCKPGTAINVRVKVKNISSATWPSGGSEALRSPMIHLGNHWLDSKRRMRVRDDGRAGLPNDLKPGDEVELSLRVFAPGRSGTYQLELDMVQEGVAWFHDRGSETCRIPVQCKDGMTGIVRRLWGKATPRHQMRSSLSKYLPRMEMHGVPKEDVVQFLAAHGGKVLRVDEKGCIEPALISHSYFATK
jgi:SAM-dependent methyltransferase